MSTSESSTWNTSSVSQALTKVFDALMGEKAPLVISYGSNSVRLWTQDGPSKERWRGSAKNGLILVWDRLTIPSSYAGRDTTPYLHPLIWSVCALRSLSSIKLAVLDCDSTNHATGKFYQVVEALDPAHLPFRMLTNPCHCVADCLAFFGKDDEECAAQDGDDAVGSHCPHSQAKAPVISDLLIHKMRTMLTERGQESAHSHHVLTNTVGPLILMSQKQTNDQPGLQHALLSLFQEIGLITHDDKSVNSVTKSLPGQATGSEAPPVESPQGEVIERNKESVNSAVPSFREEANGAEASPANPPPVRLLLVDDQWEDGWDKWVESMLPAHSGYFVEKTAKPDILIEAVHEALARADSDSDGRFCLRFRAVASPVANTDNIGAQGTGRQNQLSVNYSLSELADAYAKPQCPEPQTETILLLDLRLFLPDLATHEAEFVRTKLLPLCRLFEAGFFPAPLQRRTRLAWPEFTSKDLKDDVEAWCKNPKWDTKEHWTVLSLLPRLLALVDFSLPIVLFSSTGEPRILKKLRPYENIITDFEKPRFTGQEGAELIEETEERFRTALAKAARLLEARRKCREICLSEVPSAGREKKPEEVRYVELFLDEQDWRKEKIVKGYFTVGGCFAVYDAKDKNEADAQAEEFDERMVKAGVRYFYRRRVGVVPSGDIRMKRHDDSLLPSIQECLKNCRAPMLGMVRLRIPKEGTRLQNGLLFDPLIADNRYHLALKTLLELFVCESVPALAGSSLPETVIVSVFAGTRVVSISKQSDQKVAVGRLGFTQLDSHRFYSMDRSQVFPIIADILYGHNINRATDRLFAVKLPYRSGPVFFPEWFRCRKCGVVLQIRVPEKGCVDITPDMTTCECDHGDWQPDYRALHYFADQLLHKMPGDDQKHMYSELFDGPPRPGEFDEILDEHLSASLTAARCLDLKDIVGAVVKFPSPDDTLRQKPRSSYWLQERLKASLPTMSGAQFLRIAHDLAVQKTKDDDTP